MKRFKHIIVLAMMFMMAIVIAPMIDGTGWEAEATTEGWIAVGTCEYQIAESAGDKTLTIRPVDNQANGLLTTNNATWPWHSNKDITKIVIKPGVVAGESTANMFYYLENVTQIDGLNNLDTSNVEDMSRMFAYCEKLTCLDLSSFNTEKVTKMDAMFIYSKNLQKIIVSEGFTVEKASSRETMFAGCSKLVGGLGTTYDINNGGKEYARLDGGPNSDTPGYFTGGIIEFDVSGHGTVAKQNVAIGGLVTKPNDPVEYGYEFLGWYKDPGCTTKWDFANDKVTGDMTLYAGWKDINSIQKDLEDAKNEIAQLEKELNDKGTAIETKLTELEKAYKDGDTALATKLEAEIAELQNDITAINTTLNDVQERVNKNKTDIGTINSSVASINNSIASLNSTISSLNLQIAQMQQSVTGIYGKIAEALGESKDYTDEKTKALQDQIDELKNEIAAMKFEAKKVSSATVKAGKKTIVVKWKAVSGADTYRIYYKDKTTNAKAQYITTKTTSYKIKSLKKNHKYTVKVRAIKTIGGKNVYSKWSNTKTISAK